MPTAMTEHEVEQGVVERVLRRLERAEPVDPADAVALRGRVERVQALGAQFSRVELSEELNAIV